MLGPRSLLVLLLATALLLAGCGSKPKAHEGPEPTTSLSAGEGTASIRGIVVDDSQLPLAAVEVGLVELGKTVETDEGGAFAFTELAAGDYRVVAQRLGYQSLAKQVSVGQEPLDLVLTMTPIAIVAPYVDVFGPFDGMLACGFSHVGDNLVLWSSVTWDCSPQTEPVLGEGKNDFGFEMTSADLHSVVGETRWTSSAAGTTKNLATFFTYDGADSEWWCAASGPSPTKFVWSVDEEHRLCESDQGDSEEAPTQDLDLQMDAFVPFTSLNTDPLTKPPVEVTIQQRFQMMVTLFYGQPPPAEYTALPDA